MLEKTKAGRTVVIEGWGLMIVDWGLEDVAYSSFGVRGESCIVWRHG